jgi:hypothetical protein
METGGQWTGKTDNKKGPSANTATAGAKEIKVPYLFDERSDTALPRLRFLLRAVIFKLALPLHSVVLRPTSSSAAIIDQH